MTQDYRLLTEIEEDFRPTFVQRSFGPLTSGGIRQSTFTLISAAIGGGILCLPYVFSIVGIVMGVLILFLSAFLAYASIKMLLMSAAHTGVFSYGRLFATSVQWSWACSVLDAVTLLFGVGVVIAYFVFLGDFVPALLDVDGLSCSRLSCILGSCLLATPFAIPNKLSALQYITPFSSLALLITAIVVVIRTPPRRSELLPENSTLEWVISPSLAYLKAFAISVSSFICHTNVVSVASELVDPSEERSSKIAFRAASVQLVLYLLIAICGYISFGSSTAQNFLNGYPDDDMLITGCRLLLSLTIFFGLPLNTNPTAISLVNIFESLGVKRDISFGPIAREPHVNDMFPIIRIFMGVSVLVVGAVAALFLPGIADVMSFLGGSLGALIMLVFPAVIYMHVFKDEMKQPRHRVAVSLSLLAASICIASVIF